MTYTFKDIFFNEQSLRAIEQFYMFHGFDADLLMFNSIINQKFDFGLIFQNGNHFIKTPLEYLIQQFESNLGRSAWAVYDEDEAIEVWPGNFFYESRRVKLVVIENEFIKVEGIPNGKRFHILCAKAKKPSLLNFKKFKRVLGGLLKQYELITASSAKCGDKLIGKANDWRFQSCRESNRLHQFWQKVGFKCDTKDKYKMFLKKEG